MFYFQHIGSEIPSQVWTLSRLVIPCNPSLSSTFSSSLDVESLFTNIPLEETIENCVNDLFFDKSKIDNLTKQDAYDLLSAPAKESIFIFEDNLYRLIDGVAIGFPLDPTLVNSFLCHYEKEWLNGCPIEFKPKFFKR